MARLKDRSRQIPQSFKFYQPETRWSPPLWASFDTIVDLLLAHRRANSFLAKKNNWNLDPRAIADEVDAYNAKICEAHGWTNFIDEGAPLSNPRRPRSLSEGAAVAAAGAKAMLDLFGPGGKPVDSATAEARASVCVRCPLNQQGDWTRFFTVPAADIVRTQLSIAHDLALTTGHDAALGVCDACGCPLKLKVWPSLPHILAHLSPDDARALDPNCWITRQAA